MNDNTDTGIAIVRKYFDDFTDRQWEQLSMLKELYTEWNARINVISRKDIDALYEKHVLHSLSIAAVVSFNEHTRVLDIGTGGGFPGIPLAILFPDTSFYLVDATGKKIKVVNAVAAALQLKNVTASQTRVEDIKGRKFHFVVSRAVAPLKELWSWSKPLLQRGNITGVANGLICLKGGDLHQEIADSGCRPRMIALSDIFPEDYFREKYLLHISA